MKVGQGKNGVENIYKDIISFIKEYSLSKSNVDYIKAK